MFSLMTPEIDEGLKEFGSLITVCIIADYRVRVSLLATVCIISEYYACQC